MDGGAQCLEVSVRLRPAVEASESAVAVSEHGGIRIGAKAFEVFAAVVQGSDQQVAYERLARPLLEKLRAGYSCTFLAYGQTGSGKTHTVFGPTGSLTEAAVATAKGGIPPEWGLFPRLCLELLQGTDERDAPGADGSGTTLHASAVEVYQERAYDLLAGRKPLAVGTRQPGRVVGNGPTNLPHAAGSAVATGSAVGSDAAFHGVHPSSCTCGKVGPILALAKSPLGASDAYAHAQPRLSAPCASPQTASSSYASPYSSP